MGAGVTTRSDGEDSSRDPRREPEEMSVGSARESCASPESHKVSEWGRTYLSRLRFLRSPDRPPLAHSRPVSSQHARLDSTLSGVFRPNRFLARPADDQCLPLEHG